MGQSLGSLFHRMQSTLHRASLLRELQACSALMGQENCLFIIVGWGDDLCNILLMLDYLAVQSTEIHILSERPLSRREDVLSNYGFSRVAITHHVGRRTCVQTLAALPLAKASAIIILAEDGHDSGDAAPALGLASARFLFYDKDNTTAADDAISRDSTCLTAMVTVVGILDGRFGDPPAHRHGQIICEVLDPRTDRLLARNRHLRQQACFFRSNALATGMFALAANEPASFNTLMMLVAPGLCDAKLAVIPLADYLGSVKGENGRFHMSYWELHDLVRQNKGDLLLGWMKPDDNGDDAMSHIIPGESSRHYTFRPRKDAAPRVAATVDRSRTVPWSPKEPLLVVTRRQSRT